MKYLLLLFLIGCSTITPKEKIQEFDYFKDYPTNQAKVDVLFLSVRLYDYRGDYNRAYSGYIQLLKKVSGNELGYVKYRLSSLIALNFHIEKLINQVSQELISIDLFKNKVNQLRWLNDNNLLLNEKKYKSTFSEKEFALFSSEIMRISKLIRLARDLKIMN